MFWVTIDDKIYFEMKQIHWNWSCAQKLLKQLFKQQQNFFNQRQSFIADSVITKRKIAEIVKECSTNTANNRLLVVHKHIYNQIKWSDSKKARIFISTCNGGILTYMLSIHQYHSIHSFPKIKERHPFHNKTLFFTLFICLFSSIENYIIS